MSKNPAYDGGTLPSTLNLQCNPAYEKSTTVASEKHTKLESIYEAVNYENQFQEFETSTIHVHEYELPDGDISNPSTVIAKVTDEVILQKAAN